MEQKKLLSELKKKIKESSLARVAVDLGYRSANTVGFWIENNKIPEFAIPKVRDLLQKEKANASN